MNTDIIEGNKLIAVFDGWCIENRDEFNRPSKLMYARKNASYTVILVDELKYHASWDWLMPVIRKIKDYLNNMPNRPTKNHCCQGDLIEVDIQCHLWELNIEKTWQHAVEFIKWYNSVRDDTNT